jgi:hypothetical protein
MFIQLEQGLYVHPGFLAGWDALGLQVLGPIFGHVEQVCGELAMKPSQLVLV